MSYTPEQCEESARELYNDGYVLECNMLRAYADKWDNEAPSREDQYVSRENTATAGAMNQCADELRAMLSAAPPAPTKD